MNTKAIITDEEMEKQAEMEMLMERIINKIRTASYKDLRIYYYFVCGDDIK